MNLDILQEELTRKGFTVNKEQLQQFGKFADLLVEQNKTMNLTALIEENQIIKKHFIDSLFGMTYIKEEDKILDVGCGAGFPSLPLKIMLPENEFYLIDSLKKRIKFIEDVVENVNIKKVLTEHIRIEEAGQAERYREKFDVVLARAVAPLNTLLEYCIPLLKRNGRIIAYKGEKVYDEIEQSQRALKELFGVVEKVSEYTLDEDKHKRYIVVIRKKKETPKKYPRGNNKPKKQPL